LRVATGILIVGKKLPPNIAKIGMVTLFFVATQGTPMAGLKPRLGKLLAMTKSNNLKEALSECISSLERHTRT
jgi:hypothetical protein